MLNFHDTGVRGLGQPPVGDGDHISCSGIDCTRSGAQGSRGLCGEGSLSKNTRFATISKLPQHGSGFVVALSFAERGHQCRGEKHCQKCNADHDVPHAGQAPCGLPRSCGAALGSPDREFPLNELYPCPFRTGNSKLVTCAPRLARERSYFSNRGNRNVCLQLDSGRSYLKR